MNPIWCIFEKVIHSNVPIKGGLQPFFWGRKSETRKKGSKEVRKRKKKEIRVNKRWKKKKREEKIKKNLLRKKILVDLVLELSFSSSALNPSRQDPSLLPHTRFKGIPCTKEHQRWLD